MLSYVPQKNQLSCRRRADILDQGRHFLELSSRSTFSKLLVSAYQFKHESVCPQGISD